MKSPALADVAEQLNSLREGYLKLLEPVFFELPNPKEGYHRHSVHRSVMLAFFRDFWQGLWPDDVEHVALYAILLIYWMSYSISSNCNR